MNTETVWTISIIVAALLALAFIAACFALVNRPLPTPTGSKTITVGANVRMVLKVGDRIALEGEPHVVIGFNNPTTLVVVPEVRGTEVRDGEHRKV